jgi:hypothetical protein
MLRHIHSKMILWVIEAIVALNILYLSGYPLVSNPVIGFGGGTIEDGVENFLTGSGPYTLSFWLRIISVIAAVVILLSWPRKSAGIKTTRRRARADFVLAVLLFYVSILSIIFGTFETYYWTQPFVYSMIMSVAFIANSEVDND